MALESPAGSTASPRHETTFQRLVQQHPADASYQIGMAYACAMLFEATRTDPAPRPIGPKATLVVSRGAAGVAVDVSQAPAGLSDTERELWQMLRSIGDELRGVKH